MKLTDALWFVAVVSVHPSLAVAAEPQPAIVTAANGSYALDQDSPDSSISSWQLQRLSNVNALHAKLTVRRLGAGRNPTFGLSLANEQDTVLFQAFTTPGKKTLVPLVTESADHTEKSTLAGGVFVSAFDLNETVDVDVSWSPAGVVTVTLRDKASRDIADFERRTVTMRGGPPTILKVIAISGEAEWKPLEIGTSNPAP
jgi:hypothetical protein